MEEQKPKRIVRVFFSYAEQQFCVDRPVDDSKTEQENCDSALDALLSGMSKVSVVPALMLERVPEQTEDGVKTVERGRPVIVNLSNIDYLSIVNVGIYAQPTAQEQQTK